VQLEALVALLTDALQASPDMATVRGPK